MEPTHGKSDSEMAIAIENLSAMTNSDDMDLIIELLQQNNWDESLAASAFFAHQVATPQRAPEPHVRPAMEQRQEQLIPDQPQVDLMTLFQDVNRQVLKQQIEQAKMQRRPHKVYRVQNSFEEIAPPQEPGMLRRFGRMIKSVFFCSNTEQEQIPPQEIDRISKVLFSGFKQELDKKSPVKLSLWDKTLFQLCDRARAKRLPILLLVTNDFNEQVLTAASSELTKAIKILPSFLVAGFTQQQGLIPEARYMFVTPADQATFYAAFATDDGKLKLIAKVSFAIDKPEEQQNLNKQTLVNFLTDIQSQFMIFNESDIQQPHSPYSVQTEMPQSDMLSNQDLIQAFIPPQVIQRKENTDQLLLKQQKMEYENALQQELLRQAEQAKEKQREMEERRLSEERQQAELALQNQIAQEQFKAKEEIMKIKLKFAVEPAESELTTTLTFRVPSGTRVTRRFLRSDTVQVLYDYVKTIIEDEAMGFENLQCEFQLLVPMPRKVYDDLEVTLEAAKLWPKALLTIKEL